MVQEGLIFDTTLEINMNNLVANLNYFRSLILQKTKIMAMVKAFSYGLGTYEIARLLEENNIDYLGVANTYEGIELRKEGIQSPIMVMKPEVESFDLVVAHHLTPAIFSLYALNKLIEVLKNDSSITNTHPFLISIKLDTGMHRLGFNQQEVMGLIDVIKKHPFLKVESIFSHLAASDEAEHDSFTWRQIEDFKQFALLFDTVFNYPIDKHILNTSGISRFNEAQMDMVRLGIGLYGVSADPIIQKHLLPASALKSKIAQIKEVKKGETIGYNRKGIATKNLKIATIPVGYADGLSRRLGNGNWSMMVNGQKAPIIGNVCMDMVMIDVSNIECHENEEAYIFSDENPITEMAVKIGTIPYEILTSYSPRVRRVFKY